MEARQVSLAALGWLFLRVASTSFGGLMSLVSAVQDTVVERRKLLPAREVMDGLSLASVLPGPVAINVVAYVGYRLRGVPGAAVSVIAAVLPACVLMMLLGIAYQRWGHMPAVGNAFMGVTPAVSAVVAIAAWRMGRTAVTGVDEGLLAAGTALAMLALSSAWVTPGALLVAGAVGCRRFGRRHGQAGDAPAPTDSLSPVPPPPASAPVHLPALFMSASAAPLALLKLFHVFAAMSMAMFGGGYVCIPLMQQIVVEAHGWVTRQEFIDAVALGQITPGPIVISATFVGLKVAGVAGALVATAGMFGPPAAVTVLCARLLVGIGSSPRVAAALRGVRAATVGMVLAAAVEIGKSAAPTWLSALLFLAVLAAQLRYRIEPAWLIPAAGLAGWFMY